MEKTGKKIGIKIDKEACVGCGYCESVCNNVFEIKDGKSVIKPGQENNDSACVKEAIIGCLINAIKKEK
jgi:ferredoxin